MMMILIMVIVFRDACSDSLSVNSEENIINKEVLLSVVVSIPPDLEKPLQYPNNTGTNAIPADKGIDKKKLLEACDYDLSIIILFLNYYLPYWYDNYFSIIFK